MKKSSVLLFLFGFIGALLLLQPSVVINQGGMSFALFRMEVSYEHAKYVCEINSGSLFELSSQNSDDFINAIVLSDLANTPVWIKSINGLEYTSEQNAPAVVYSSVHGKSALVQKTLPKDHLGYFGCFIPNESAVNGSALYYPEIVTESKCVFDYESIGVSDETMAETIIMQLSIPVAWTYTEKRMHTSIPHHITTISIGLHETETDLEPENETESIGNAHISF